MRSKDFPEKEWLFRGSWSCDLTPEEREWLEEQKRRLSQGGAPKLSPYGPKEDRS